MTFKDQSREFTIDGQRIRVYISQLFDVNNEPGRYYVSAAPDKKIPIEERSLDAMKSAETLVGIFDTPEEAMEAYEKKCSELKQQEQTAN